VIDIDGLPAADPRRRWASLSQAERDAAYDNNAAVADSPALIRTRNAAASAFRAAHPAHLDLPYGPGERHRWDLFPGADPAAPCLVFVHGGYWQRNGRENFSMLAEGVREHGWSAALPGYSLAPDASLTSIVGEIRSALDWLAAHGRMHGIAGPIVLSGWSAGAQLATLALDHPAAAGGMAISGVFNLGPLADTCLNTALDLSAREIDEFSPLRTPPVDKELIIAYGTAELPALVGDSVALHRARLAAGAPGDLLPIAGADHFTVLDEIRKGDGELTRAVTSLRLHR
jgi:arylformamidase